MPADAIEAQPQMRADIIQGPVRPGTAEFAGLTAARCRLSPPSPVTPSVTSSILQTMLAVLTLRLRAGTALAMLAMLCGPSAAMAQPQHLLHVTYEPTYELFAELNELFVGHRAQMHGQEVVIDMSHAPSAVQTRKVDEGDLAADVVTLVNRFDLEYIVGSSGRISSSWVSALPDSASPFASPVVFLVRAGNPHAIRDWLDLTGRSGLNIVSTNPLISGFGRYAYIGIYHQARQVFGEDDNRVFGMLLDFYRSHEIIYPSSDEAVEAFIGAGRGDVLLAWEHRALQALREHPGLFELIIPAATLMPKPRVAVVEANARSHGTLELATDYTRFMFSDAAQEVMVRHGFRPASTRVRRRHEGEFAAITSLPLQLYGPQSGFFQTHFGLEGWYERIQRRMTADRAREARAAP